MTTGYLSKDERVTTPVFDGGWGYWYTIQAGKIFTRSWSGADWSSPEPIRRTRPFSLYGEPGLVVPERPVKRSRTEDHQYSLSYSERMETPIREGRYNYPGGSFYYTIGSVAQIAGSTPPWGPNDDLTLYGRLRTRVAGSDFNAGVFLGEGKESLRMIADSANRIARGIKSARRLDFAGVYRALFQPSQVRRYKNYKAKGWLDDDRFLKWERERHHLKRLRFKPPDRDVSSLWLEFAYGWKPLLQDAYSGAEFLAHQLEAPLQNVVRVSLKRQNESLQTSSPVTYSYRKGTVTTTKWIKAKITEVSPAKLSGLTDPLSVAWELVPFSFVIDWFIPIGNYLSARGLVSSLEGTMVISTLTVRRGIGLKRIDGAGFIISDDHASVTDVTFTREVNQPIGALLQFPSMKPLGSVPSWMRAANAVSLLDQLRPRR